MAVAGAHTLVVCVIGLSRNPGQQYHLSAGIGKSCLCYRFMHPGFDEYIDDHPSLVALHEFESPEINNVHFLYWGSAVHTYPIQGTTKEDKVQYHVVEHTVLYQDVTSQPFTIITQPDNLERYIRRSTGPIESPGKVSFISRDNMCLLSDEYEKQSYPAGISRLQRGFIVVIDASLKDTAFYTQLSRAEHVLTNLMKHKRRFVVVVTKRDVANPESLERVRELRRKYKTHVIETSASKNVNIHAAFRVLASRVLKRVQGVSDHVPSYEEAIHNLLAGKGSAKRAFVSFLKKRVKESSERFDEIESNEEYKKCNLVLGKFEVDRLFAERVLEVRDEEVSTYAGVNDNPDMRQEFLEEFVDDRSDLSIYTVQLRSWIQSRIKLAERVVAGNSPEVTKKQHSVGTPPLPKSPSNSLDTLDSGVQCPSVSSSCRQEGDEEGGEREGRSDSYYSSTDSEYDDIHLCDYINLPQIPPPSSPQNPDSTNQTPALESVDETDGSPSSTSLQPVPTQAQAFQDTIQKEGNGEERQLPSGSSIRDRAALLFHQLNPSSSVDGPSSIAASGAMPPAVLPPVRAKPVKQSSLPVQREGENTGQNYGSPTLERVPRRFSQPDTSNSAVVSVPPKPPLSELTNEGGGITPPELPPPNRQASRYSRPAPLPPKVPASSSEAASSNVPPSSVATVSDFSSATQTKEVELESLSKARKTHDFASSDTGVGVKKERKLDKIKQSILEKRRQQELQQQAEKHQLGRPRRPERPRSASVLRPLPPERDQLPPPIPPKPKVATPPTKFDKPPAPPHGRPPLAPPTFASDPPQPPSASSAPTAFPPVHVRATLLESFKAVCPSDDETPPIPERTPEMLEEQNPGTVRRTMSNPDLARSPDHDEANQVQGQKAEPPRRKAWYEGVTLKIMSKKLRIREKSPQPLPTKKVRERKTEMSATPTHKADAHPARNKPSSPQDEMSCSLPTRQPSCPVGEEPLLGVIEVRRPQFVVMKDRPLPQAPFSGDDGTLPQHDPTEYDEIKFDQRDGSISAPGWVAPKVQKRLDSPIDAESSSSEDSDGYTKTEVPTTSWKAPPGLRPLPRTPFNIPGLVSPVDEMEYDYPEVRGYLSGQHKGMRKLPPGPNSKRTALPPRSAKHTAPLTHTTNTSSDPSEYVPMYIAACDDSYINWETIQNYPNSLSPSHTSKTLHHKSYALDDMAALYINISPPKQHLSPRRNPQLIQLQPPPMEPISDVGSPKRQVSVPLPRTGSKFSPQLTKDRTFSSPPQAFESPSTLSSSSPTQPRTSPKPKPRKPRSNITTPDPPRRSFRHKEEKEVWTLPSPSPPSSRRRISSGSDVTASLSTSSPMSTLDDASPMAPPRKEARKRSTGDVLNATKLQVAVLPPRNIKRVQKPKTPDYLNLIM